jgi:hypothetical protein
VSRLTFFFLLLLLMLWCCRVVGSDTPVVQCFVVNDFFLVFVLVNDFFFVFLWWVLSLTLTEGLLLVASSCFTGSSLL